MKASNGPALTPATMPGPCQIEDAPGPADIARSVAGAVAVAVIAVPVLIVGGAFLVFFRLADLAGPGPARRAGSVDSRKSS